MIAALLDQTGGGRTTPTLHLASAWAGHGTRITIIDADARGSSFDWSAQRAKEVAPRFIGVIGHAHDMHCRDVPALAHRSNPIVIDGRLRVAWLRWAPLAVDLTLIPVRPSPFDRWTSAEMLKPLQQAHILRPRIVARFVLNRCAASTMIAREAADRLADHEPRALTPRIRQRAALADVARSGRPILDVDAASHAAPEIVPLAAEVDRAMR